MIYQKLGRHNEAIAAFDKAISLFPNMYDVKRARGQKERAREEEEGKTRKTRKTRKRRKRRKRR